MTNKPIPVPTEISEKDMILPTTVVGYEHKNGNGIVQLPNGVRKPRTSQDFYEFCTTVLKYENYEPLTKEDIRNELNHSPPLDSSGSSVNSESTSSGMKYKESEEEEDEEGEVGEEDDSDSFNLVTCYCGKPFAGRPMIECLECLTWIHLSCAKIRKNKIPEVFLCAMCKRKHRDPSPINKLVKRPRKAV